MVLALTLGLAVLIGISLGLLGGGGSILTVPILSYVAGMEPKSAIAASLFVVAVTSIAGVVGHARAGRVMWRTGALFGIAGMAGAFLGGRLSVFVPAHVLMLAFGIMMVVTATAMIRRPHRAAVVAPGELGLVKALGEGFVIGMLTGVIGVGGGFLIVPALVLLGRVPMERAIGTSLLVIGMNSAAGLVGQLSHATVDWSITLPVTAVAVTGSILGGKLAGRIPPLVLRRVFGLLVVGVAVVVLAKELGL